MYSINREENGSESLINLVAWWYHFLQLTLMREQDAKPGCREEGEGGEHPMIYGEVE